VETAHTSVLLIDAF